MHTHRLLVRRGMSLNRLQIFKFTQFKKILYIDSDTMVFKVRAQAGAPPRGRQPAH